MATRLYFSTATTGDVNASRDAWTRTADAPANSNALLSAKVVGTDAGTRYAGGNQAFVAGNTVLAQQYVSAPMQAGIAFTTSDTVSGVLRVSESATNDNINRVPFSLRVFSEDGTTLRATLKSLGSYGSTLEWAVTPPATRIMANASALSNAYTTVAGDRLVLEVGCGFGGSGSSVTAAFAMVADQTTDLALTDGATGLINSWFEVSRTVSWQAPATNLQCPTPASVATGEPLPTLSHTLAGAAPANVSASTPAPSLSVATLINLQCPSPVVAATSTATPTLSLHVACPTPVVLVSSADAPTLVQAVVLSCPAPTTATLMAHSPSLVQAVVLSCPATVAVVVGMPAPTLQVGVGLLSPAPVTLTTATDAPWRAENVVLVSPGPVGVSWGAPVPSRAVSVELAVPAPTPIFTAADTPALHSSLPVPSSAVSLSTHVATLVVGLRVSAPGGVSVSGTAASFSAFLNVAAAAALTMAVLAPSIGQGGSLPCPTPTVLSASLPSPSLVRQDQLGATPAALVVSTHAPALLAGDVRQVPAPATLDINGTSASLYIELAATPGTSVCDGTAASLYRGLLSPAPANVLTASDAPSVVAGVSIPCGEPTNVTLTTPLPVLSSALAVPSVGVATITLPVGRMTALPTVPVAGLTIANYAPSRDLALNAGSRAISINSYAPTRTGGSTPEINRTYIETGEERNYLIAGATRKYVTEGYTDTHRTYVCAGEGRTYTTGGSEMRNYTVRA